MGDGFKLEAGGSVEVETNESHRVLFYCAGVGPVPGSYRLYVRVGGDLYKLGGGESAAVSDSDLVIEALGPFSRDDGTKYGFQVKPRQANPPIEPSK